MIMCDCGATPTCFGWYKGEDAAKYSCDECCMHTQQMGFCETVTEDEVRSWDDDAALLLMEVKEFLEGVASGEDADRDVAVGLCDEIETLLAEPPDEQDREPNQPSLRLVKVETPEAPPKD